MKITLAVITFLISISSRATEIVSEQNAKEVKTYTKGLTVRTTCKLMPEFSDRDDGTKYPAYCSDNLISSEMEDAVKIAYPSATKIMFSHAACHLQTISECGVKTIDVEGVVTYTAQ